MLPEADRRSPAEVSLRFPLPAFPDVFIHLIRECKLVVDITHVRVVGVAADGKVPLSLPLEDALAA